MQANGLAGTMFAMLRPVRALGPGACLVGLTLLTLFLITMGCPLLILLTRSLLTPHEKTPEVKALKHPPPWLKTSTLKELEIFVKCVMKASGSLGKSSN